MEGIDEYLASARRRLEPGWRVILFCNDGCNSSLAAAILIDLGVDGTMELIGGYRTWKSSISDR